MKTMFHSELLLKLSEEIRDAASDLRDSDKAEAACVTILANLRHVCDLNSSVSSFATVDRFGHNTYLQDKDAGRIGSTS